MFVGGQLIKRFDAFLHLYRAAAAAFHSPCHLPDRDQFALNRVLAGLGGPPASARVNLVLGSRDAVPLLCLFLISGPDHCPVGLMDGAPMARLKQMVHVFAHSLVPTATGGPPQTVAEACYVISDDALALQPLITYNEDGEVAAVTAAGGRNQLGVGPGGAPYKVVFGPAEGVELDLAGPLHPVTVRVDYQEMPFAQLDP